MNTLAIREEVCFDTILKDVDTMTNMCSTLMKTKHFQSMGEAGLFAIVQKAKSLNIHPLEALNGGLYYVQGKVGMSSEMMASLIRQKGHSIIKDPKSDNTICILHGKRCDNGDTWTITFSWDDAKRAGLAKNMYEKYPSIMLYNRAMSMLARQLFPDVIKGAGYTHEELIEIKNNNHAPTHREESVVEIISKEMADTLIEILGDCEVEYQETVMNFIKKHPINANSLYELPVAFYDRVKNAAIKKKEEAVLKAMGKEDMVLESVAMEA